MVRVYVSSTSYDLEDCREQVRDTLRRLGHEDVAMEYYVAEDVRPVDKCLRDVAECDLYICIAAWRYGHSPEGYKQSITELEYRRAVKEGKTCLTFVLADNAPWPGDRYEFDAIERVRAFRMELRRNRISKTFTSPEDLARQVAEAVHQWEKERGIATPGSGTDWDAYRATVIAKHRLVPMETLTGPEWDRGVQIPLTRVFVTQQTSAQVVDSEEEEAAELREPSLQVIGRDSKQVILGEAGSGKSTLLRYTMLTLCDPGAEPWAMSPVGLRDRPFPFLIELRQYAREKSGGQVQDFIDYLATRAKEFYGSTIEPQDLRALLQEDGKALVLFDGLDEILHVGERVRIADQLDAFARQYPGAKIVATSRITGYNPERLQGYDFSHYTLRQFGLTEIREFLPRWYANDTGQEPERHAAELADRIAKNPRLRELAGNPLLLTMMAVIHRHEELPERRWKLYERCTAVLLEHWDVKAKHIARNESFPLTRDQKEQILCRVSIHMLRQTQRDGRLNVIPRQALMWILSGYLMETFDKNRGDAELSATEILDHLCERSYILAEIGEDTFGFVHRTFMEYFAAHHVLAKFNRSESNFDWLTREIFGVNWRQDEWQEVLLLLTAMLAGQGSPIGKVVDYLHGLEIHQPWNVVFAARCLAEAGASDNSRAQAMLDALVREILAHAQETDKDDFVGQALSAFSMLALAVHPSKSSIVRINKQEGSSPSHRIVTWQMRLALRPKEARFAFAISALENDIDSVRIAAITALEREWPGHREVGPRLLDMLRTERLTRVRQAAVQALRRSWPKQPGLLNAIRDQARNGVSIGYADWLIRYIASEWPPDLDALDLMLQLVGTQGGQRSVRNRLGAELAAAASRIIDGWSGRPGIVAWLQHRYAVERNRDVRDAVLLAIAEGGMDDEGMVEWLQQQVDEVPSSSEWPARALIMRGIVDNWAGRPELLPWLKRHAIQVGKPEIRIFALTRIANGWDDPSVNAWIELRATDDPDVEVQLTAMALAGGHDTPADLAALADPKKDPRGFWWPWEVVTHWHGRPESLRSLKPLAVNAPSRLVRRAALGAVYAYRASSATASGFLHARLVYEPDSGTRAMILLWLTEAASGGTALPRGLAVTLDLIDPASHQVERPFSGFVRPRTPEDDQLRATLTGVAEQDEDWGMRGAAAQAVVALWGDRPEVSEWLDERIRKDPSKSARALLKSFRTR